MADNCIDSITTAALPAGVSGEDFAKAMSTPSTVSVGEISVSNRSVHDLIELDKHLRKRRRCNPLACVSIGRMIPPGPCE